MTSSELKIEIQKSLDRVPESALADILELLKKVEKLSDENFTLSKHLKMILEEDKNLLSRLAK